jgi:hypothetical protein
MRTIAIYVALLAAFVPAVQSQKCFDIHGRAVEYRGDGFFAIWHVGTHHSFYLYDNKSADLVCQYFDCESGDRQPALFADFTLCPFERHTAGAAQGAVVKAVEHPRVVTDWPPAKSAREYVQFFYDWYVPRAAKDGAGWQKALKLARWDLSPALARMLEDDAEAQAHCRELNGLEFDPFLGTQEPSSEYRFGASERVGSQFQVKVFRAAENVSGSKPDFIAVVARDGDRWYFENFLYPKENTDLLSILKSPRPECTVPRSQAEN